MPTPPDMAASNGATEPDGTPMPDHRVVVARTNAARALAGAGSDAASEQGVGSPYEPASVADLVAQLFAEAGFDRERVGTDRWNPLGEVIRPGDRVLVKPNWVHHNNGSGAGLESLITNAAVLAPVLEYVLRAGPGEVVVADAPIQGCDLPRMLAEGGYDEVRRQFAGASVPIDWRDLRRTTLHKHGGDWERHSDLRPVDRYVLFDLAGDSLLEPISDDADRFRVTMYNPDLMRATHAPGRHQYLIAREAIDADVVINLPKLKTHKKAGLTGALKNLVGINGNKDYLPHHRLGGSQTGGDCYQGGNPVKLFAEWLSDASNRRDGMAARVLRQAQRVTYGTIKAVGWDTNLEGSWHGNDTVWRMSLDLNRILRFGRSDGTLAGTPQRRVLSITDAIVAGEGEGPLSPTPHPLGMLTLALNSAAAELVHAHLMGLDWQKIHIVREAFGRFPYPICDFPPDAVEIAWEGRILHAPWPRLHPRPFVPPKGWAGHCEMPAEGASGSGERASAASTHQPAIPPTPRR